MPSPFPGLDPWLDDPARDADFQFGFRVRLAGHLNRVLPERYYARTKRCEWFYQTTGPAGVVPAVVLPRHDPDSGPVAVSIDGELRDTYTLVVEIRRVGAVKGKHKRVTFLEAVSPEARTGVGAARALFEQRRLRHRWNRLNRVEIDIWRSGTPPLPVAEDRLRGAVGWDGPCVYTFRRNRRTYVEVRPLHYDRPLPTIAVPVDSAAGDVALPLQPIYDECYCGSGCDRVVNYDEPPDLPLPPEQRAWADEILRKRGP